MPEKLVHLITAVRPNFMKIAPLSHALRREPWARAVLVHTGQHYDLNMSDVFFRDLGLSAPDHNLEVGSGPHGEQTGQVMARYERLLMEERPDVVVVPGDVNSTLGCTLAAVKMGVKVAHLEAGLRSFDRTMPEEINRVVTDAVADLLWTPSPDADENLAREGVPPERIERIGNIMIDSLEMLREVIEADGSRERLGLDERGYVLTTLHRPANVDDPAVLARICGGLCAIAHDTPVCFPVHPRTAARLDAAGLRGTLADCGVRLMEPLGYTSFMNLVFGAKLVLTDSGGVQGESTYLGIPCLTVRPRIEQSAAALRGANRLIDSAQVAAAVRDVLQRGMPRSSPPPLWDGCAAPRAVASLKRFLFPAEQAAAGTPRSKRTA
ncbi:UDP-N-acetylglucosamine 2-epimerase [Desulfovibrio sp. X2]|uniref:non-hydrolyzing UDP-N-acetylglucosamine 2-epimerase n=1 Tax=Desulfovibrio sp. X2 TaxID=941449 RepID=UPI000358DC76|nr:UDP-N-acetylglucosamine 2-epimerase (non-hydrolyzing) [Desulfovibrio sp. X2]EPR37233.1 UDP-N-acetylglucosamine 2-epimerase [Desulfovibrio sp. X2]